MAPDPRGAICSTDSDCCLGSECKNNVCKFSDGSKCCTADTCLCDQCAHRNPETTGSSLLVRACANDFSCECLPCTNPEDLLTCANFGSGDECCDSVGQVCDSDCSSCSIRTGEGCDDSTDNGNGYCQETCSTSSIGACTNLVCVIDA